MTSPNGVAATPARDLTETEVKELQTLAYQVESTIVNACTEIRTKGVVLAEALYVFLEKQLWRVLDYDSLNAFLAGPDISLSKGHVMKLTRVYRELCVDRGLPRAELEGVDFEKVQLALPALKDGKVKDGVLGIVSDARALSRSAMQEKYGDGDPDARLNAETEPERATCSNCGSYVEVSRLKGKA